MLNLDLKSKKSKNRGPEAKVKKNNRKFEEHFPEMSGRCPWNFQMFSKEFPGNEKPYNNLYKTYKNICSRKS